MTGGNAEVGRGTVGPVMVGRSTAAGSRGRPARRARLAGAALWLVLAVASLAACGTAASPGAPSSVAPATDGATVVTPAATAAPSSGGEASAVPGATSSTAATPRPRGAFTFELPASWKEVALDGDYAELIAGLRATNSTFADSLDARLRNVAASTSYFAFDASESAIKAGDLATLAVTETDLPPGVSVQTLATTVQNQVTQLVETDVPLREIVTASGPGFSIAYAAPLTRPDGKEGTVAVTQVFYALPGRGFVMTFSAPPETADAHAQAVAQIAQSFLVIP